MTYIIIFDSQLTRYIFNDLEDVKVLFTPVFNKSSLIQKFVKFLYYKISDKFYCKGIFPRNVRNVLDECGSNDTIIYVGEDVYTCHVLASAYNSIKHKIIYFWNPTKDLGKQKISRFVKHQSGGSKPEKIINYLKYNGLKIATFDKNDAESYDLSYFPQFYRAYPVNNTISIDYDFFFLGRDKGRKETLTRLQAKLNEIGTTRFEIVNDSQLKDQIEYYDYIEILRHTRAICEINQPGQKGLTIRAMEALFFKKKLITNNKDIINYDIYDSNNILLYDDNTSATDIMEFMKLPYKEISHTVSYKYEIHQWINKISNIG